jgi:hypothetical protein
VDRKHKARNCNFDFDSVATHDWLNGLQAISASEVTSPKQLTSEPGATAPQASLETNGTAIDLALTAFLNSLVVTSTPKTVNSMTDPESEKWDLQGINPSTWNTSK